MESKTVVSHSISFNIGDQGLYILEIKDGEIRSLYSPRHPEIPAWKFLSWAIDNPKEFGELIAKIKELRSMRIAEAVE